MGTRPLAAALIAACLFLSPATAAASSAQRPAPAAAVGPVAAGVAAASPASDPALDVEEGPAALTVRAATANCAPIGSADRVATAIAASRLAFPGTADTIVLCTGWNWPDALGGAALAGASNGPLLLTKPDALPSAVVTEAVRLDARRVIVIGSRSAVSTRVADTLAGLTVNGHGLTVTRIEGAKRWDTAAAVASATVDAIVSGGGTYDGTAFFATARTFPDALAAAPIAAKKGWPVLLVDGSKMTTATEDAVARLGVTRGVILGSKKAVSAAVETSLTALLPTAPERLQGADRYLTAVQVARFGVVNGLGWDGMGLARGEDFADAMAGGAAEGRLGSVLLLTSAAYLQRCVFDEMTAHRAAIHTVRYLGGGAGLKQFAKDGVVAALNGDPYPVRNGMIFPVDGKVEYEDSFGAPRSGGRTHEGCDIMAARNTPVVATLSGTVSSKEGGLGGKVIYLDADNGWRFYYAHLNGWAVRSGRVHAGQKIGYVGNTGNAAGGPTHCHFQMWMPSGKLVNPYPYLKKMARL